MQTIIFDLDGTLVDSVPDLQRAANRMLADRGLAPVSVQQVTGFVGNGVPTLVGRCLAAAGAPDDRDLHAGALEDFERHYGAAPAALTRAYDGVEALLAALDDGGTSLGVCTNKPAGLARRILDDLGLGRHFGAIVGGDCGMPLKPDPAPLIHCIESLGGVPGSTLFVGDSEVDASTAAAAGVRFALFSGGYRKSPVAAFKAALVFDRFEVLGARLAGLERTGAGSLQG